MTNSYMQLWKKEEHQNTLLVDGGKGDIVRYVRISLGFTDRKQLNVRTPLYKIVEMINPLKYELWSNGKLI